MLGRYWRGVTRNAIEPAVEREVIRAADFDPPVPYANDLLAHDALARGRVDEAAERFLREGTYFRERAIDVSIALEHWSDQEAWDRIDQALADPRVAAVAPPWLQLRSAVRRRRLESRSPMPTPSVCAPRSRSAPSSSR